MIKFTFFWAFWFAINAAYAGFLFSRGANNIWIHIGISLFSLCMFIYNIITHHIKK